MDNKIEKITPFLLLSLLMVQIIFLGLLFVRVRAVEEHLVDLNSFFMPNPSTELIRNEIVDIPVGDSPYRGVSDAPVTIIEFSDFNCTYCQQAQETLDELLNKYEGQIQIRYKYFPLNSDPNSSNFLAARAAECAYQQNAFWEMHDRLFENQTNWDKERLIEQAKHLNLDEADFMSCLDSEVTLSHIRSDKTIGQEYGVNSTPTFFINGRLVIGASPLETFEGVIDEAFQELPN
jgi:protein-disulfide isomerase